MQQCTARNARHMGAWVHPPPGHAPEKGGALLQRCTQVARLQDKQPPDRVGSRWGLHLGPRQRPAEAAWHASCRALGSMAAHAGRWCSRVCHWTVAQAAHCDCCGGTGGPHCKAQEGTWMLEAKAMPSVDCRMDDTGVCLRKQRRQWSPTHTHTPAAACVCEAPLA